jgi:hypothetical protein
MESTWLPGHRGNIEAVAKGLRRRKLLRERARTERGRVFERTIQFHFARQLSVCGANDSPRHFHGSRFARAGRGVPEVEEEEEFTKRLNCDTETKKWQQTFYQQ